jgi:hypothetical protein
MDHAWRDAVQRDQYTNWSAEELLVCPRECNSWRWSVYSQQYQPHLRVLSGPWLTILSCGQSRLPHSSVFDRLSASEKGSFGHSLFVHSRPLLWRIELARRSPAFGGGGPHCLRHSAQRDHGPFRVLCVRSHRCDHQSLWLGDAGHHAFGLHDYARRPAWQLLASPRNDARVQSVGPLVSGTWVAGIPPLCRASCFGTVSVAAGSSKNNRPDLRFRDHLGRISGFV